LTLMSEWIGPKTIDIKFRKVIAEIIKFWSKNKQKRKLQISASYYDSIVKCKGIVCIRKLNQKWTSEFDQSLQSYHSTECEPQLKKVLDEYLGKQKRRRP
jgi:hypothetical protein